MNGTFYIKNKQGRSVKVEDLELAIRYCQQAIDWNKKKEGIKYPEALVEFEHDLEELMLIKKLLRPQYRILTEDRKIKFAGTDTPSWMDYYTAKLLVDKKRGEKVYEYNAQCQRMWEIL